MDTIKFDKFVLISTIAVYDNPTDNAYGRNRLYLENYLINNYENVSIVRLPSLFGEGLKKNSLYDLKNKDFDPEIGFKYELDMNDGRSKYGKVIEDLEKTVAVLGRDAHPPIFSTRDLSKLEKRLNKIEKEK